MTVILTYIIPVKPLFFVLLFYSIPCPCVFSYLYNHLDVNVVGPCLFVPSRTRAMSIGGSTMNHLHHNTTSSNSVTTATTSVFETPKTFASLRLDVDKLFSEFDDGKKGWLSLQDVQAATLAVCGFWPHRDQVIGYCQSKTLRQPQPQPQHTGQQEAQQIETVRVPPTDAVNDANTWTHGLSYFRLKQPKQLQHWLVEAGRIADHYTTTGASSSQSSAQLPPPLTCQQQLSDPTVSQSLQSTDTETALTTTSQLPVAVGRFSWEEIFDALDINSDGVIDYTDLSAVMTTVNDGPCSLAYARIPSLQELSGCLMDMIMDTRPAASQLQDSRHSKTDSLTRRQFLSIMKGRA